MLQVIDTVAPLLDLSIGLQKSVLVILVVGFPVALVLAWALELTPQGLKRDEGPGTVASNDPRTLDRAIIAVLAIAVIYFLAERLLIDDGLSARLTERSIAVLPFENMSNDAANDPFTAGIHDDLLTQLSRIRALDVVSRTSVLPYSGSDKQIPMIAAELGVVAILEGGVQRSGDRVRINVQLIDAVNDVHLWAETYDRELTAENVFDIQDEIAEAIAEELHAKLTDDERQHLEKVPTDNIAALETYFVGKRLLEDRTRESLFAAVQYFEKVVDLDPNFALGWSGLADAYMLLPEYTPFIDRQLAGQKSREAVEHALAIDPDIPEVKSSEAWHQLIHNYDWRGAEAAFREALDLSADNTNVLHWISHTVSWQGRHDEAIEYARRAVIADRESRMMKTNLAYILVDAGRFDEGLQIVRDMRNQFPEYVVQRRNQFLHELRAGYAEQAADTFIGYTEAIGADPGAAAEIGAMFVAYAATGQVGAISDELIARAQLGTEDLAQVLAFVGDAEGTLNALREAIDSRSGSRSVLSMKINPAYGFVRDDPRFQAMLAEVGLAD